AWCDLKTYHGVRHKRAWQHYCRGDPNEGTGEELKREGLNNSQLTSNPVPSLSSRGYYSCRSICSIVPTGWSPDDDHGNSPSATSHLHRKPPIMYGPICMYV